MAWRFVGHPVRVTHVRVNASEQGQHRPRIGSTRSRDCRSIIRKKCSTRRGSGSNILESITSAVVSLGSPMSQTSIAQTCSSRNGRPASPSAWPPNSCAKLLGGMVVESDVEDGDVWMLKLQALFSHRKRSVSDSKQLLFIQQQVSFIKDRPFIFACHA